MKAERRHELQTNALADWLNKTIAKVQPHANTILIGALLVVGGIVAVVMLSNRSSSGSTSAWGEYYQATIIDDADKRITELGRIAEAHPKTAPGLWSRLMAGEARLVRGNNVAFKDRVEGSEDLEKAQEDFEAVIAGGAKLSKRESGLLLQRAHWGLARTYEALAMHDKAVAQYDALAKAWPESAYGKAAADKVEYLKGMSDWFNWYAKVDPTTIKTSATQEGLPPGFNPGGGFDHGFNPGTRPSGNQLPDDPEFTLPGIDDLFPDLDLEGEPGAEPDTAPEAVPDTVPDTQPDNGEAPAETDPPAEGGNSTDETTAPPAEPDAPPAEETTTPEGETPPADESTQP